MAAQASASVRLSLCNLRVLCVSVVVVPAPTNPPQRHKEHKGCTEKKVHMIKRYFPFTRLCLLAVLLTTALNVRANVSVPDVLSDHMMLQQHQRVPIWGKADPGEVVIVRFAKQTKKTIAGPDGKWLIKLEPMVANATPSTMTISGNNTIELKDILVGEVWLVAGQSNMQRLLSETA